MSQKGKQKELFDTRGHKEYYPPPPPGGFPKFGYTREMPLSLLGGVSAEDLTEQLPVPLKQAGYQLFSLQPSWATWAKDPVVLYNPWGEIVAEWEESAFSLGELQRVCKGLPETGELKQKK